MSDGPNNQKLPFEDLLADYGDALSMLGQWGIRIAPQARLRTYQNRLMVALEAEPAEASLPFISQLSFDLREIDEIIEIVSSFSSIPNENVVAKLKVIAAGTEHPDAGSKTNPRDIQYELYLYSLFTRAGMSARIGRVGEADLFIQAGGNEYPVEAKRPNSDNGFDRRLHEAVQQLERLDCLGIVTISLDQIARPRGHNLRVESLEELNTVTQDCFDVFTFEHQSEITGRLRDRDVVAGVLYTMKIPGFITGSGTMCLTSHAHFDCFLPEHHPLSELCRTFASHFGPSVTRSRLV